MALTKSIRTILPIFLVLGGIVISLGIGILSIDAPVIAIIAVVGSLAGLLSLSYPNVATQVFILILYTNAAAVATKFHNVPFIIAAAFPFILLLPFAYYVFLRGEKLIMTKHLFLVIALLMVQIFGTIFSINVSTAFENLLTFVIEGVVIYSLVVNVVRTRESLRGVVTAICFATIFLGILPLIQYATGMEDNNFGGFAQIDEQYGFTVSETSISRDSQSRYMGSIGEQNRYAQTMFMLMMLILPHAVGNDTKKWRLLAIVTIAVAGGAGVLAFSRGAAIGMGIMFVVAVSLRVFSLRDAAILMLTVILIFMVFPQYLMRIASLSSVTQLLGIETEQVSFEEPDGALTGRLTQMWAAGIVYLRNPIIGVGPGMFKYYAQDVGNQLGLRRLEETRRSHSLPFDILSNTGTLGFLSFGGLIYLTIRDLLRVRNGKKIDPFLKTTATGFILAIITYLSIGLFLHMAYIRYFWVTMAVAMCVIYIANNEMLEQKDKHEQSTQLPA